VAENRAGKAECSERRADRADQELLGRRAPDNKSAMSAPPEPICARVEMFFITPSLNNPPDALAARIERRPILTALP